MLFARPARDYFKKIRLHFPFGGLLFSGGSFAIEGLRLRSERDYTEVLMQGFNYPLPAVAKRSAEALVKLDARTC